jgi:hypothetical protein
MIDYGRRGREVIVDPEVTRRKVISRVVSGEYKKSASFTRSPITVSDDINADILAEAALRRFPPAAPLQVDHFDHARDLRKHEVV